MKFPISNWFQNVITTSIRLLKEGMLNKSLASHPQDAILTLLTNEKEDEEDFLEKIVKKCSSNNWWLLAIFY